MKNDNLTNDIQDTNLTTSEKKRYFYSAEYFLEGAAKKLSQSVKKQRFEILDRYKIKRLEEDHNTKKNYLLQIGLLVGGIWLLHEGIKKAKDVFPYNVMININKAISDVQRKFKQKLGVIAVNVDVEEVIQPALKHATDFLKYMVSLVGLSFDVPQSYVAHGDKLMDGSQRKKGIFGDLIEMTFHTVLWYSMQRTLPYIIKKFWNLPLKTRIETDRGILEQLWNDNTGYFHDIGNPYRKRLESVTVANEGLNSLQEMWANQGKDLEELFDFKFGDKFWYITGVEDVSTNAKTKHYTERLNNQVNAQLKSMQKQINSGIFVQDIFDLSVKDEKGNLMFLYVTHKNKDDQLAANIKLHGITYTATMPYSGLKKGLFKSEYTKFKPVNDIILKADEVVTKFTYDSSKIEEQEFIDKIRKWWNDFGVFDKGVQGYWYHYSLESIFALYAFLPYLVRLETYAALNSIDGAHAIFDSYLSNNKFLERIESNYELIIDEINKVDEDYEKYKRGIYTSQDFIKKKLADIENMLKEKKYLSDIEKICSVLSPKVLDDANISRVVYQLQGLKNQYQQLFVGSLGAIVVSNTSTRYEAFDAKKRFEQVVDSSTTIEGKQVDSKVDSDFQAERFFIEDKNGGLSEAEASKLIQGRKTSKIPDVKLGSKVGDIVEHGGRKWKITEVKTVQRYVPTGGPPGSGIYMNDYIFYGHPDDGIVDKLTYRTIKEDGSIWLEDFYRYKFNDSSIGEKFVPVENTKPRKDTSNVTSYFGEDLRTESIADQMSTVEKSYTLSQQIVDIENLIFLERQKRTNLLTSLSTKLKDNGLALFIYPIINKINERGLAR